VRVEVALAALGCGALIGAGLNAGATQLGLSIQIAGGLFGLAFLFHLARRP
jgi:hypothetical protein